MNLKPLSIIQLLDDMNSSLEDYKIEQGEWTPVIGNLSGDYPVVEEYTIDDNKPRTSIKGQYYKFGNLVIAIFSLVNFVISANGGTRACILGLPYTVCSTDVPITASLSTYYKCLNTEYTENDITALVYSSNQAITFSKTQGGNYADWIVTPQGQLRGTVIYITE